ncbi:MAG TPA: hypothetical protein VM120_19000 [Bryobacteraceae bacterium]|nr:hypothetical protein [Bryobacteraceae bacterium]
MRRLAVFVLWIGSLQAQWERKQNIFQLRLENGATAEVEWISVSTFRVRRGIEGPPRKPIVERAVECKATENSTALVLETSELRLQVSKKGGLITVMLPAGLKIYSELVAQVADGKAVLETEAPSLEKYYGLGARPHPNADARGLAFSPAAQFYISARGYAFWIATQAPFEFDLAKTRPDRVRITSSDLERLEYYFAFGPSLKEIWEERHKITGSVDVASPQELELIAGPRMPRAALKLPALDLCGSAKALVHASLSGVLMPALDLRAFRAESDAVFRRAATLGVFSPIFQDSAPFPYEGAKAAIVEEARIYRKRLSHFLVTYADETRARGYPMIHPLLHQFPRDPEAGRRIDAYMLGDEFLLAPDCDGTARREVYLPMGVWTNWKTEQEHRGRQTASLEGSPDGVTVLVKNGSIVPLAGIKPTDPTELHYYPKIGGEFFIYEPGAGDYSQAHAGPAADIYRLEMESKVSRDYEWVVHHFDRPKGVDQVDAAAYSETSDAGPVAPAKWRYDSANRTLHIGIRAAAHSDVIVNIR